MGLAKLDESEWLQPRPDLAARTAGFDAFPEGIQLSPEGDPAGRELAAMLVLEGALPEAAAAHHEDMCLLTRRDDEEQYRLVGAAVAWPSDWTPADKLGLPLRALHAPIQGYEEQLASGVDHFMAKLKPGAIYGRCNWFIAATGARRWVAGPPERAFAHVTAAARCSSAQSARLCVACRKPGRSCSLSESTFRHCAISRLRMSSVSHRQCAACSMGRGNAGARGLTLMR